MEQELINIVQQIVESGMKSVPPAMEALALAIRAEGIVQIIASILLCVSMIFAFKFSKSIRREEEQGLVIVGGLVLGMFSFIVFLVEYPLVKVIAPLGWAIRQAVTGG